MGRVYSFTTGPVAVTAERDLLEIANHSTKTLKVMKVAVEQSSDYGDSAAEGLEVQLSRAATTGSGGSPTTVTGRQHDSGDPAFSGSAKYGNTSDAGTQVALEERAFNAQAGFLWQVPQDQYITIPPSGFFVVHLSKTPADELTMHTTVTVEEMG